MNRAVLKICFLFAMSGGASAVSAEAGGVPQRSQVVWVVHPIPVQDRHALQLIGVVTPKRQSTLGFQVAGRIVERRVEVGDRVEAGTVLYRLDDRDYRLALQNLQAQLEAVTSDLQTARRDLARLQDLLRRKLVSQQQVDAAQNRVVMLQAQRQSLLPQIETARNRLAYTVLRAPAAGTVLTRRGEVGQVVAAGTPVVSLALGDETLLALDWPEHAGIPPRTLSISGKNRPLTLPLAYTAAQADPHTHTRRVYYTLPADAAAWGQTLPVAVQVGKEEPLWRVPITAVQMANGQAYLLKVTAEKTLARVPVEVVRLGHNEAWVRGGLQKQDAIVRMGVHVLRPGQIVRVGQP